jgi:hypothetical protein
MRVVKDGLAIPSGESEESEDSRWTRAVGDRLACPQENGRRFTETADYLCVLLPQSAFA